MSNSPLDYESPKGQKETWTRLFVVLAAIAVPWAIAMAGVWLFAMWARQNWPPPL